MHPLFRSRVALAAYVAGASMAAALLAAVWAVRQDVAWHAAWAATSVPTLVLAFLLLSSYAVCQTPLAPQHRMGYRLVLFVSASACAGLVLWVVTLGWSHVLRLDPDWAELAPGRVALRWVAAIAAVLYAVALLVHDLLRTRAALQAAQAQVLQAQNQAQQAQLEVLRAQIHPHFLFNCLNSISALTHSDARGARAMTIALADYFRQTLTHSARASIPLQQELDLCQCFLDIEAQRFGARMQVQLAIDAAALTVPVPSLILQPLVENAVKHGIALRAEGGTVALSAHTRAGWLHLRVENPCPAVAGTEPAGTGLGLRHTRQRLKSLYGDGARVQARAQVGRYVVELALPCTPQPSGPL